MKNLTKKEIIDLVQGECLFWIKVLGLCITRLRLHINDTDDEDLQDLIEEDGVLAMRRDPARAYMIEVFIDFNKIKSEKIECIKKYCCHEIMHALLDEICWACGKDSTNMTPMILAKHEEFAEKLAYLLTFSRDHILVEDQIQVIIQ